MDRNSVSWHGPMPAVVTPFTKYGAIDDAAFAANLEGLLDAGATGFIVGGCTGEFWAMSREERAHVFGLAARTTAGRGTVIAGASAHTAAEAIWLARAAEDAGCDGAMVLPPYFVPVTEEETIQHYERIAAEVGLPLMLYNIPQFAGNAITPELALRLSEIDSVVAIKESAGDWVNLHRTLMAVRSRLRVFCGPSTVYGVAAVAAGADGFIDCFPNVWRPGGLELFHAAKRGDLARAQELQELGIRLTSLFTTGGCTLYSATKAGMELLGLPGGVPRPPLAPTTPEGIAHLRRGLIELGLMEAPAARAASVA